jgi:hypothetical protein
MTQAWVTLTGVDGRETATPTDTELASVLAQLFSSQGEAGEPASAALRFGYADGLMYVAEVSSNGEIGFEEWSDRDCEIALAKPRRMSAGLADAVQLWSLMARRQVSRIRELAWLPSK